MIHNLRRNPNDKPLCKTGKGASNFPYHISNKVVNQNGNVCWYNYKYNCWCFEERGLKEEVIWWKEIE